VEKDILLRFQKKIELDLLEGCWLWTSSLDTKGYGRLHIGDKLRVAHRLSYEHWNGSIPEGLQIDHLCRNRNCVNPQHLEAVTQTVNQRRGIPMKERNIIYPVGQGRINQQMTHCKRGHEFTPSNINWWKNHRTCRKCKQLRHLGVI